jgi:hypothetical protein
VNGNPVTGTEGSIPPATSFDEDQIEIVTVIQNAGLVPDHNDLTQLWQAIQALIGQKYITTAVVRKVHGAGADFVDLNSALAWLAPYIITASGSVTFMIAAGRWTYTQTVEINHPNANRIFIQGAALLGGAPDPANISVTGYHNSADGTNQIIYLRSVFGTELSFTGGVTGFRCLSEGVLLRYLLITGSQSAQGNYGNGIEVYSDVYADCLAIWGMGNVGIAINGARFVMSSSLSITVCFSTQSGIVVSSGAFEGTSPGQVIICSNGMVGLYMLGGWFTVQNLDCRGNNPGQTVGAIYLKAGSHVNCTINSSYNNACGVYVAGASTLQGEFSNYVSNTGVGLYMDGGKAWINGSWLQSNYPFDVDINGGGMCDSTGAGYGTWSPPWNSWINGYDAYLRH